VSSTNTKEIENVKDVTMQSVECKSNQLTESHYAIATDVELSFPRNVKRRVLQKI